MTLKDIEGVDPEWATGVKWVKENDLDEFEDLEMFFCADQDILGEVRTHELKPGGADIPVTQANKVSSTFQTFSYIKRYELIYNFNSDTGFAQFCILISKNI